MQTLKLKIIDSRISEHVPLYSTPGSAGMDIRACIHETQVINPGETVLIPSGFAIHIADTQMAGIILPRSGLGHKSGIILGNSAALIDSDYTGEWKISLWNRSDKAFTLAPMERIAQMIFIPIIQVAFELVDEFEETQRGAGGFGSTGTK